MRGRFPTEKITLIKGDGSIISDYEAHVQPKLIVPSDSSIVIDIGDVFERELPNGGSERYEVLDPKFYEKFGSFDAHYQLQVRKLGLKERMSQSITYNLNGSNSRINNNSTDNSTNIVNDTSKELLSLFESLKKEICLLGLSDDEAEESLEVIEVVEAQVNSEKPSRRVVSTLINSLPQAVSLTKSALSIVEILQTQGVI